VVVSLGALIGANAPVTTGEATDFAGVIASVTTSAEIQLSAADVTGSPEAPVDSDQNIPEAPITADLAAPMAAPKIARPAESSKLEHQTVIDGVLPEPIMRRPAQESSSEPAPREAPSPDAENSSVNFFQPAANVAPGPLEVVHKFAELVAPIMVTQDVRFEQVVPQSIKPQAVACVIENQLPLAAELRIAPGGAFLIDPLKPLTKANADKPESFVTAPGEARTVPLALVIEKPAASLPDRAPTFSPLIADAVRDLVNLAQDKNVRFNVRPETLGAIAVTIERSEAGPTLRLGVETQAAVQAVRHAEPNMNDQRGQTPFVHVTVDLNAPGQRGRGARAATIPKRHHDLASNPLEQPATQAAIGRYA
jgi:hypothetical protein